MKATQINLIQESYYNLNFYAPKSHYKLAMYLGRFFPKTKAQAKEFLKNGCYLDVLNSRDVERVEDMLNKHGLKGNYKYTKSKQWVRLVNSEDLVIAIRKEFAL